MSRNIRVVIPAEDGPGSSQMDTSIRIACRRMPFPPHRRVCTVGSPFDTGFTALQTLFTGTVAKVASLIAIVIGGYGFAHGEPGAKKTLAGVAAGTGIAVLAVNVLSWLWGV